MLAFSPIFSLLATVSLAELLSDDSDGLEVHPLISVKLKISAKNTVIFFIFLSPLAI
jgi:hypothetical protein